MLADLKNNLRLQYIYFILAPNIRAKFIFLKEQDSTKFRFLSQETLLCYHFPLEGLRICLLKGRRNTGPSNDLHGSQCYIT